MLILRCRSFLMSLLDPRVVDVVPKDDPAAKAWAEENARAIDDALQSALAGRHPSERRLRAVEAVATDVALRLNVPVRVEMDTAEPSEESERASLARLRVR